MKYDSITFAPVFQCDFNDGDIVIIRFTKEGKTVCEYKLINKNKAALIDFTSIEYALNQGSLVKEGTFSEYKNPNTLFLIGKYINNEKVGEWVLYDYNQKVKLKLIIDKGISVIEKEKYYHLNGEMYSGEYFVKDENNMLIELREVKDGVRHGKTIYYDNVSGKKQNKEIYKEGMLRK